jgi:hypothetical protein
MRGTGANVTGVKVEVCPNAGPTMRLGVPRRQSGGFAARTISHMAIFVAERAD